MTKREVVLYAAEEWDVRLLDTGSTAILFKVKGEVIGALLHEKDLGLYTGRIVNAAVTQRAKSPSPLIGEEAIATVPIATTDLAFGRGRSDEEVMLTLRCGRLTLTFALEVGRARQVCAEMLSLTTGHTAGRRN